MHNEFINSLKEVKKEITSDLDVKIAEVYLKSEEQKSKVANQKKFWSSPIAQILIPAIFGVIGVFGGKLWESRSNTAIQIRQFENQFLLDQKKQETSLILKAVETNDPNLSTKNLKFLLAAGLINDTARKIQSLIEKPDSAKLFQTLDTKKDLTDIKSLGDRTLKGLEAQSKALTEIISTTSKLQASYGKMQDIFNAFSKQYLELVDKVSKGQANTIDVNKELDLVKQRIQQQQQQQQQWQQQQQQQQQQIQHQQQQQQQQIQQQQRGD